MKWLLLLLFPLSLNAQRADSLISAAEEHLKSSMNSMQLVYRYMSNDGRANAYKLQVRCASSDVADAINILREARKELFKESLLDYLSKRKTKNLLYEQEKDTFQGSRRVNSFHWIWPDIW